MLFNVTLLHIISFVIGTAAEVSDEPMDLSTLSFLLLFLSSSLPLYTINIKIINYHHRIIQIERGIRCSLVPPPLSAMRPDQVTEDFIQSGLVNQYGDHTGLASCSIT